jgi:pimeloyl-ACP methyl ester carboxylesterase
MSGVLHVDSTDGVRLAVHDLGGDGPPLLLSHATGFHGLVWRPLAAALATEYHCWSLDYRGHGDSTEPVGGSYEWRGAGEDAWTAVQAIRREGAEGRLFGIGHSMGGAALLMAELNHPGSFAALALFEPIVLPPDLPRPEGGPSLADGARRRRSVFASHDEAYENFRSKPPLNVLAPDALRAYVDHGFGEQPDGTVLLKCTGETEARTYEGSQTHDTFDRLPQVRCPVLVLSGAFEPFQPASWALQVADRIPAGSFIKLDELSHFGPMEGPELVARTVAEYFRSVT